MYHKEKIAIIGLGYVGAPLAYLAASNGYRVVGIDNSLEAINMINTRSNLPSQLKEKFNNNSKHLLLATDDYSKIQDSKTILICIPTPTKRNIPDVRILNDVITKVGEFITNGALVIVESTLAPGMTYKYVEKKLEKNYGLRVNVDYDLAYCPERIDPGNKKYWVGNINRVCGASSEKALARAVKFYKQNVDADIVKMGSIEEAEMVKVWENSIRNISIAQANLLAMLCDKNNFSVNRVIEGLKSKTTQFPLEIAMPGLGPGGHCIPEDIHYLIKSMSNQNDMGIFKQSVKINDFMSTYAYKKLNTVVTQFNKKKIVMLGKAYKPNSSDTRKSKAISLYNIIKKKAANVVMLDPVVKPSDIDKLNEYINEAEVIIISCPHDIFLSIDFLKCKNLKYIFDCYNKLDKSEFIKTNIKYIGIGE